MSAEEEFSLLRAKYKYIEFASSQYYFPDPENPVQGLKNALFGEHQELEAFLWAEEDPSSGILIKGEQDSEGNSFAYILKISSGAGGAYQPTSLGILVGAIKPGDPFSETPCEAHEYFSQSEFMLGTANFKTEHCNSLGGGNTTSYHLLKITVTDTSEELLPEEREPYVLEGEELESALSYTILHHNSCDSFRLTLPHAEYAATTAAEAGCGGVVDGAPERDYSDTRLTVLYRVRYKDGAWSEVREQDCPHYIFSCAPVDLVE